jgi:hypothetical protein
MGGTPVGRSGAWWCAPSRCPDRIAPRRNDEPLNAATPIGCAPPKQFPLLSDFGVVSRQWSELVSGQLSIPRAADGPRATDRARSPCSSPAWRGRAGALPTVECRSLPDVPSGRNACRVPHGQLRRTSRGSCRRSRDTASAWFSRMTRRSTTPVSVPLRPNCFAPQGISSGQHRRRHYTGRRFGVGRRCRLSLSPPRRRLNG